MPKFKIGATIPATQYGNLMPEYEIEADTFEEAEALALPYIEKLWARYCEPGRELRAQGKLLEAFVGGQIYYDDASHSYTWNGQTYLSGSQYAKQFEEPFDAEKISQIMAKTVDYQAEEIRAMWQLKADISTGFGTAIHAAIELYDRYKPLSKAIDAYRASRRREAKSTHHHNHPIIEKAVEGFYAVQTSQAPAETEVLVVDHALKRAGRIDRLVITGPNKCIIQDIKTNADITKSLPTYWKQLSFYAAILASAGWVVDGLEIYHWNGTWKLYEQ